MNGRSMLTMPMSRLLHFDLAKAICIILVAIGHYVPDGAPQWYERLHDWIYLFHMPLFMFASGYIYQAFRRDEPYGVFVLKKVKRLIVPYFTASVLIITLKLLSQRGMYVENPVTWLSYAKMLYLPEAGFFLWFIWALLLMFCLVPFFRTPHSRLWLFAVAVLWHYWHPLSLPRVFCLMEAARMLMWFMAGVVLVDQKDSLSGLLRPQSRRMWRMATPMLFAIGTVLFFAGVIGRGNVMMPWLGVGSVMIVCTWLSRFAEKAWLQPLLVVGNASYIVYLLHTTCMGFAKSFVHKVPAMNGGDDLMFCLGVLIVVLAGVAIPILLYTCVLGKTRLTKAAFGLK